MGLPILALFVVVVSVTSASGSDSAKAQCRRGRALHRTLRQVSRSGCAARGKPGGIEAIVAGCHSRRPHHRGHALARCRADTDADRGSGPHSGECNANCPTGNQQYLPRRRVIVFCEATRATELERVGRHRRAASISAGGDGATASEPGPAAQAEVGLRIPWCHPGVCAADSRRRAGVRWQRQQQGVFAQCQTGCQYWSFDPRARCGRRSHRPGARKESGSRTSATRGDGVRGRRAHGTLAWKRKVDSSSPP